jgi:outer membrane protein
MGDLSCDLRGNLMKARWILSCTLGLLVTVQALAQEPFSFQKAIELALAHSSEMAVSRADEIRAYQSYLEARDAYIPQLSVGSNVGYAYGFPLSLEGSAPTVFNVTAQSTVYNPALNQFTKAAKAEWGASQALGKDRRQQLILDTALGYIELSRWEERLPLLRSELDVVRDMQYATRERVTAGVDNPVEQTRADLAEAQTRVHIAEAEGAVDILRTRLAQLTGLPVSAVQTVRESIPAALGGQSQPDIAARAVEASPAVESAQQSALSKELRAKGEHRSLYPSADFAAQYGVINTSLTDFEKFFVPGSFQPHNVTFGLVLRFPFLNQSQRARAQAADAEALRARKEAEQAKNKAVLDALQLQHGTEQLVAARDVAQLRYKLAQSELDSVHARMQAETASQRELQSAAVEATERTLERINADFAAQKAQLELLRLTGELEKTILPAN